MLETRRFAFVAICLALWNSADAGTACEERGETPRLWQMVLNYREPTTEEQSCEEAADKYWMDAVDSLHTRLTERVRQDDVPEEEVDEFVAGFGTAGPLRDLLWIAADPSWLNEPGEYSMMSDIVEPNIPTIMQRELRWRDKASLALARRAAGDRQFLERYYRLQLWARRFVPDAEKYWNIWEKEELDVAFEPVVEVLARQSQLRELSFSLSAHLDAAVQQKQEMYGVSAKYFVMSAHALSRNDLLHTMDRPTVIQEMRKLDDWRAEHWLVLHVLPEDYRWRIAPASEVEALIRVDLREEAPDSPGQYFVPVASGGPMSMPDEPFRDPEESGQLSPVLKASLLKFLLFYR